LSQCIEVNPEFSRFKTPILFRLDEIGISVRYTDMEQDPGRDEAKKFLKLATEIEEFVVHKL
jgi:hypothetical protein